MMAKSPTWSPNSWKSVININLTVPMTLPIPNRLDPRNLVVSMLLDFLTTNICVLDNTLLFIFLTRIQIRLEETTKVIVQNQVINVHLNLNSIICSYNNGGTKELPDSISIVYQ